MESGIALQLLFLLANMIFWACRITNRLDTIIQLLRRRQ
jgi:hypothetical protein